MYMKIILKFFIIGNAPGNGRPGIVDTRGSTTSTSGSGTSLSVSNNEGNTNNNKGRQLFEGKPQS